MLGKLAERIAIVLMGKHKPIYDPGGTYIPVSTLLRRLMCSTVDCGDYVVVSNAKKIKVTGKKAEQLVFRHHTMFAGGLKEIPYKTMMAKKPDEVRSPSPSGLREVSHSCRSSDKQSQACYPRIHSATDDWIGYGYLPTMILVSSSTISLSDGKTGH